MKTKLRAIFYGLCAGLIVFILVHSIGAWVVGDVLVKTGGVITANEILNWKYLTPGVLSILAFYFTYHISKDA